MFQGLQHQQELRWSIFVSVCLHVIRDTHMRYCLRQMCILLIHALSTEPDYRTGLTMLELWCVDNACCTMHPVLYLASVRQVWSWCLLQLRGTPRPCTLTLENLESCMGGRCCAGMTRPNQVYRNCADGALLLQIKISHRQSQGCSQGACLVASHRLARGNSQL
jgi:hypothetical protein